MELKEGMFVRTNITDNCNNVYIRKISEFDDDYIFIDEDVCDGWGDLICNIREEDIEIADFNPAKVVKVGDYVNGLQVDFIEDGYVVGNYDYDCWNSAIQIKIEDIKSILTKEEFEQMEYKI